MAVFTPMTKDEWMQNHFSEHFHDKVNKQALLELTLGINTIFKPDNPLEYGFKMLAPCERAPVMANSPAVSHGQKVASAPSPHNAGFFSAPNQEKLSQTQQETHTPTKKR